MDSLSPPQRERFVLPEGLTIHPPIYAWWEERSIRHYRRMAHQYTPAVRYAHIAAVGRCSNLHPNLREGEQCSYCGTAPEFHLLDFDSEEHLERWLLDSWHTHGPRRWKERTWEDAEASVRRCPPGTYSELCHLVNSELRAKYGSEHFPPENDDELAEQMRAEEKAQWIQEWDAYNKREADELWADYDQWEESQRKKREGT